MFFIKKNRRNVVDIVKRFRRQLQQRVCSILVCTTGAQGAAKEPLQKLLLQHYCSGGCTVRRNHVT